MIKGILIDVYNRTISEVDVKSNNSNHLESMYSHLKCSIIEAFYLGGYSRGNSLFVDEEGLFNVNEESCFFTYEGMFQPFVGMIGGRV